ncbi:uncharacterized protein LOC130674062 [Microplitis mediator]|uniref:uncharacterized protein LOC130674062 n=1 Tax=Microplitis mediator TaxID=375433 RepID=UPI002552614A|nr:uncharacterized protein LOC130674062 [Microplitis mediator]
MCCANNSNPLIMTSDFIDDYHKVQNPFNFHQNSSVIIINDDFKADKIQGIIPSYPTYVLSFKSIEKLSSLIKEFRSSVVWSITSKFLVLDTDKESHCANAGKVLGFLWKFDLLESYYLCYDYDKESTIIYTLNPFTNYAPPPWTQIDATEKFDDKDSTKWTLYNLRYSNEKNLCHTIKFDKTKILEGHNVKITIFANLRKKTSEEKKNYLRRHFEKLLATKEVSLNNLLTYINATSTVNILPTKSEKLPENGDSKSFAGPNYDIYDKRLQLAEVNFTDNDIMTLYRELKFSILTKKTNYITGISEITSNIQFIIMTIVVLLLIFIIIMINNRYDVTGSILEVIRMLASMGFMSPIDCLSMRIIFFTGFLFSFLVVPDFQGQISALLSHPTRRNVDSLKDLYDNRYHVYYEDIIHNDIINERLWVTDEDKEYLHPSSLKILNRYVNKINNSSNIACIHYTNFLLDKALKSDGLHLSRKIVFKIYFVYRTRKNWALKEKLDKIGFIPLEAGFVHYRDEKKIKERVKKLVKLDRIENNDKYEQVNFNDSVFIYIFFGVVLVMSFTIFGIEMLFARISGLYRQFQMRGR